MTRGLRLAALAAAAVLGTAALVLAWAWHDRPALDALPVPEAPAASGPAADGAVTATWLGVTTILFDDGETRLLTDGFFSRPGAVDLLRDRPVAPDAGGIDAALERAGIDALAAVMTVHSHYDHAMDTAEVARRTGAQVLGSASTANAARGAGLPEDRIEEMEDGAARRFGHFTVTFLRSRHVPARDDGTPPFPGTIDAPLVPPAPVSAWREGGSFSLVIAHPRGTALVQGSAGFVPGALEEVEADVVFLGVGALAARGEAWATPYWQEVVGATGARRVIAVHFDDFTRPWGDVRPFPRLVDDVETTLTRLAALAEAERPPVRLERPPFARPVRLF